MATTDSNLLDDYIRRQSGEAFAELVSRYIHLVHGAAMRQVRHAHLADDVTQATFIVLSRRASSIRGAHLPGWLLMTTRYCAMEVLRKQTRLIHHEHEAAMIRPREAPPSDTAPSEGEIIAGLDEALLRLAERDRTALALRYLQNLSTADVAAAMGLSVDTAQKVIARALPKMKKLLARKGIILPTTAALATILAHESAHAAPAGLASSLSAASVQNLSIAKGAMDMMNVMRWMKIKAAAAILAAVAGVGGVGVILHARAGVSSGQMLAAGPVASVYDGLAPSAEGVDSPAGAPKGDERIVSFDYKRSDSGMGSGGVPGAMGKKVTVLRKVESDQGIVCEIDGAGVRTVTDERSGEQVVFNDRAKTAVRMPGGSGNPASPSKRDIPQTVEEKYMKMVKGGARDAGAEKMEGRSVEKFIFDKPPEQMGNFTLMATNSTIWTDAKTGEIVGVSEAANFPATRYTGVTEYSHFVVNPKLPYSLSIDPPAGYKVTTAAGYPSISEHFFKQPGKIVADAIKGVAPKGDSPFPNDLESAGIYVKMDRSDLDEGGNVPVSHGQVISSKGRPPTIGTWWGHLNVGRALGDLPKGSWGYLGAGKTRGKGDELIFWCKSAEGYEGVYGDLSVKEMEGPGPVGVK